MTVNFEINDRLILPSETAEFLHVTTDTLSVWRCTQRYNLPFVKVGRKIAYRLSDIQKFIESRTFCKNKQEEACLNK